jgi:hypothetical protein
MARPRISISEKIENSSVKIPESGCWIWMKSVNRNGYGKTSLGRNTNLSAHRASYEEKYGPIPNGLMALHHCDIRSCVNPDHIFLGTQQDNMTDKVDKKRQAVGEFHGMSKLTEQQAMRAKFGKEKTSDLAKEFGCSAVMIRQIRQGKYWKYLER